MSEVIVSWLPRVGVIGGEEPMLAAKKCQRRGLGAVLSGGAVSCKKETIMREAKAEVRAAGNGLCMFEMRE